MDITKCKGVDCPVKESCIRYTAKESKYLQSWFVDDNVGKIENNRFTCDVYWGKNAENIFNELNDIVNGKFS